MLLERERPAAVEARGLERAVAAQESFVRDRDPRLVGGPDGAVDAREHGGLRLGHVAARRQRRARRAPPRTRAASTPVPRRREVVGRPLPSARPPPRPPGPQRAISCVSLGVQSGRGAGSASTRTAITGRATANGSPPWPERRIGHRRRVRLTSSPAAVERASAESRKRAPIGTDETRRCAGSMTADRQRLRPWARSPQPAGAVGHAAGVRSVAGGDHGAAGGWCSPQRLRARSAARDHPQPPPRRRIAVSGIAQRCRRRCTRRIGDHAKASSRRQRAR